MLHHKSPVLECPAPSCVKRLCSEYVKPSRCAIRATNDCGAPIDNRVCFTRLYPSNDSRHSLHRFSRARYSSREINRADLCHSWRSTCANSSMVVMCFLFGASQRFDASCNLKHTFMIGTAIWYYLIVAWFSKEASAYKRPPTPTLSSINLTSRHYHTHAWRVPPPLRQGNSWHPCRCL